MTTADRIYELVNTMLAEKANEVLNFVEFLQQKTDPANKPESYPSIPPGTLTGLRGIAKQAGQNLTQEELRQDYTNYLTQKYE
jgi:Protein of unknown function (DUF2281)